MAIVIPAPGPMRGSIGAWTWSRNKGGSYIRKRTTPTNPNSSRQQTARSFFGTYAAKWTTTLTQAYRDQWDAYAETHYVKNSLGQDVKINGLSWYVMLNCRLADAGATAINAPPAGADPDGFSEFTVGYTSSTGVDVTYAGALGADERMQLWQTLPGTTGQTPNINQARLVGYSAAAAASPISFTLPFEVQVGQQCTFYGKRMNADGQVSVAEQDVVEMT